jgi:hypothetical protein
LAGASQDPQQQGKSEEKECFFEKPAASHPILHSSGKIIPMVLSLKKLTALSSDGPHEAD